MYEYEGKSIKNYIITLMIVVAIIGFIAGIVQGSNNKIYSVSEKAELDEIIDSYQEYPSLYEDEYNEAKSAGDFNYSLMFTYWLITVGLDIALSLVYCIVFNQLELIKLTENRNLQNQTIIDNSKKIIEQNQILISNSISEDNLNNK